MCVPNSGSRKPALKKVKGTVGFCRAFLENNMSYNKGILFWGVRELRKRHSRRRHGEAKTFFSAGSLWRQSTMLVAGSDSQACLNTWKWRAAIYHPEPSSETLNINGRKSHGAICYADVHSHLEGCAEATGQADTYEIFPLLTLATASAEDINPFLADVGNTPQHTLNLLVTTENKTVAKTLFVVIIITASGDLFSFTVLGVSKKEQAGSWIMQKMHWSGHKKFSFIRIQHRKWKNLKHDGWKWIQVYQNHSMLKKICNIKNMTICTMCWLLMI